MQRHTLAGATLAALVLSGAALSAAPAPDHHEGEGQDLEAMIINTLIDLELSAQIPLVY